MHQHVPPRCEKRAIVLSAAVYHAQRYGNTGSGADERVYSGYGQKATKKKIDGRRQRLSVVFEAVLPNLGSSGELDYTQTRGEILAT